MLRRHGRFPHRGPQRQADPLGYPLLGVHIANATTTEDSRGGRLVKSHRSIRIDAAICAVMAVRGQSYVAGHKSKPRRRVVGSGTES